MLRVLPVLILTVHRWIRFAATDWIYKVILFRVYRFFRRITVFWRIIVLWRVVVLWRIILWLGRIPPGALWHGIFLETATMSSILPPAEHACVNQRSKKRKSLWYFVYHNAQVVTVELNIKKQFNTVSTISGSNMIGTRNRVWEFLTTSMTMMIETNREFGNNRRSKDTEVADSACFENKWRTINSM